MEYVIWCDESVQKGRYCSNFYGGILVCSEHLPEVIKCLRKVCYKHHLKDELKWGNVTAQYLEKYKAVLDVFFRLLQQETLKVRIMFRKNTLPDPGYTINPSRDNFFLFYYQFFKQAFGLEYSNQTDNAIHLRVYFDNLPQPPLKNRQFKEYIKDLEMVYAFRKANIKIRTEDIAEVDSCRHILLQCLDIVLGCMAFRLNNRHKDKLPGQCKRGRRTIAKEKLFKYIHQKIRSIYPGFHVGASTGRKQESDVWNHPYRHWSFKAEDFVV